MTPAVIHLVLGPPGHGVVQHGTRLARAGAGRLLHLPGPGAPAPPELAGARVVAQFTDRPFGRPADRAAAELLRLTAGAGTLVVSLHDLPQRSDGSSRATRTTAYLEVADAADAVVVASEHERLLLWGAARTRGRAFAAGLDSRVHIIPLPVERPSPERSNVATPSPSRRRPVVATLGFLYPGKGTEEVIVAASRLPNPPEVLNLGRPADGHEDLVPALTALAEQAGVQFSSTGWLTDDSLLRYARDVDVPVAAHRHLSASGSIGSWLAAGRRPLVLRSRYAVELAARLPGAIHLVGETGESGVPALAEAIQEALDDPGSTWLVPSVQVGPSWTQAAAALRRVMEGVC